jgi:hypothetical protein
MTTSHHPSNPAATSLLARMDTEWHHLTHSSTSTEALHRWHQLEPTLATCHNLEQLRTAAHDRTHPQHGDHILAPLARLASIHGHHDPLAARTTLQLLLPGATRLITTLTPLIGDRTNTEATVLAELAIGIATYPCHRRPRHIAANLLLDTRQRLTRHQQRSNREIPAGTDPHTTATGTAAALTNATEAAEDTIAIAQTLTWAYRNHILEAHEVTLIVASRIHGIPVTQLVTKYGQSRSALYDIRAHAEQRLRDAITKARTTQD